jgi:acyl-CoA thioester hydrolase
LTHAQPFRWPIRVYYEDTDAAGIVYYANYLRFFERARTEWLRALDISQERLASTDNLQFVVAHAEVSFVKPARLDDALVVTATIAERARTYLTFAQELLRVDELLARARVQVACVDRTSLAPRRLPSSITQHLPALTA